MRWRPRALLATAVTVTGLVALAALGAGAGFPASRPRLLSGSAWLASTRIGQATLLDGSAAEVAASVAVAPPGEQFDLVQRGAGAYAVNHHTGTVRRVDGATFAVTAPATPLPAAGNGLQILAGAGGLVALDTSKGAVATADPQTLAARGNPVPLSGPVDLDGAVLDGDGRLWVLDAATGDLVWLDHGSRASRAAAATPGAAQLVLAGGDPVIVDPVRRTATLVDRHTGAAAGSVTVDVRSDDQPRVAGSPSRKRIYLATRGIVDVCDLAVRRCTAELTLGSATGSNLGTPVESGDRLFVPDYATGAVWIVDLATSRVVAHPQVLSPPVQFELLARDGLVFFNDTDSERAGVIRLNGGVQRIAKYDPGNPSAGLTGPGAAGDRAARQPAGAGTRADAPPPPPRAPATSTPNPFTPPPPTPGAPVSAAPSPSASTPSGPSTPDPQIKIHLSAGSAQVGQAVTVDVQPVSGTEKPTDVLLSFGDGGTATEVPVTHSWTVAQTYQITAQATLAGRRVNASSPFEVTAAPTPKGMVHISINGTGVVVSQPSGISCNPTCDAAFDVNTRLTLTAQPGSGQQLSTWGGACSGTGTCQVTVIGADIQVTATFQPIPDTTGPSITPQPYGAILELDHGNDNGLGNVCGTPTTIQISASVTDPSGVSRVWFSYDIGPPTNTSGSVTMTSSGGSTYTGTLGPFPFNAGNSGGGRIQLTFHATDKVNNQRDLVGSTVVLQPCTAAH